MCLSQTGRVVSVDAGRGEALVRGGERTWTVSLAPIVLDGGAVEVGDWLLIHTGLAVAVIDDADVDALDVTTTYLGGDRP